MTEFQVHVFAIGYGFLMYTLCNFAINAYRRYVVNRKKRKVYKLYAEALTRNYFHRMGKVK